MKITGCCWACSRAEDALAHRARMRRRKVGEQSALRSEASKLNLYWVCRSAPCAICFASRRKLEAFRASRVAMRFERWAAQRLRAARKIDAASPADRSPTTLGIRRLLAPCFTFPADVRTRAKSLAPGPPLSFFSRSSDVWPRGFPSHHVQTASPALIGFGTGASRAGDESSIASIFLGWIDSCAT